MPPLCRPAAALALLAAAAAPSALAAGDLKRAKPVKELMPWYHSTDEIHQEIADLTSACQEYGTDAELTTTGPDLDVLRIKKKDTATGTKAVIVFGEHARELISPESALDFVRNLCGTGASSQFAKETLDKGVEFVIVPNANPKGRKIVEDGYYCKRTNENGVDLNRNWGDDHRSKQGESEGDEMNPGPIGFSEPETQALKELVDGEKPDIFLSVHSGAYLLGSSYGYKHGEPANGKEQDEILGPISRDHCDGDCPYGGLADMIDYKSEGCDIDYVSERVGVPYAFTWEIYVGQIIRGNYIDKARNRASQGMNFAQRKTERKRLRGKSGLGASLEAHAKGHWEDDEDPSGCIEQFLPKTKEETDQVVENWSGAYLELASAVADRKKNPPPTKANATAPAATTSAPASSDDVDITDLGAPAQTTQAPLEAAPAPVEATPVDANPFEDASEPVEAAKAPVDAKPFEAAPAAVEASAAAFSDADLTTGFENAPVAAATDPSGASAAMKALFKAAADQ